MGVEARRKVTRASIIKDSQSMSQEDFKKKYGDSSDQLLSLNDKELESRISKKYDGGGVGAGW